MPDGADPAAAGALGIAGLAGWLPVAWRAPDRADDTVLVLGATGTVGQVAVQAAKLSEPPESSPPAGTPKCWRAQSSSAPTRAFGSTSPRDLADAFKAAFDGQGPSYVFDPLWGEPGAAAVEAAAALARGSSSSGSPPAPTATLTSAAIRFKQLTIIGHTNYRVPPSELAAQYQRLVEPAIAGDIVVDVERVPLDNVADAWQRQAEGRADRKLVIVP